MIASFFGLDRRDLLLIAACGLAFTAVLVSQRHGPPPGPPSEEIIDQMAGKLGVTAAQLRRAIDIAPPPPARGERWSPEQRDKARHAFATALNIPAGRLDTVMRHRHPPPRD